MLNEEIILLRKELDYYKKALEKEKARSWQLEQELKKIQPAFDRRADSTGLFGDPLLPEVKLPPPASCL